VSGLGIRKASVCMLHIYCFETEKILFTYCENILIAVKITSRIIGEGK
jgi:hypothetical protein